MFDHPIIDVALGLIFFYVVLSLVASAAQEWLASLAGLRSKNLKKGISRLVGDEYMQKVYKHPLIKNLAKENQLPSYIAPETLGTVLLEIVAKDHDKKSYASHSAAEARALVGKIDENNPLRAVLEAMLGEGKDAAGELKEKLADWFDEGMTRISGWYKRQVKLFIFLIAAGVTVATNASSIHMAEELWRNDALRAQIAAKAQAAAGQPDAARIEGAELSKLEDFPIGWDQWECTDWPKALLGWLITIAAVSLGAPFWFDLLGKVANLKGSGGKAQPRKPA